MNLSENSQAVILLTAGFAERGKPQFPPLNPDEWNGLRQFLQSHHLEPRHLLGDSVENLLPDYVSANLIAARISALLERSGTMAVAMERWNRAGLWVCTEYDRGYPAKIKELLKDEAPSLLFGSGDLSLLIKNGVGIICDSGTKSDRTDFARDLGQKCAQQNILLASSMIDGGCGRAIEVALENESAVLIITPGKLMSTSLNARYRKHIASGNLIIVSPSDPEAAPDRDSIRIVNRLVYCLTGSVVILTTLLANGTPHQCAMQNLARGWSTLWIRPEFSNLSVNRDLLANGAHILSGDMKSLDLSKLNGPVMTEVPSDTFQQANLLSDASSRDIFYELFLEQFRLLSLNKTWNIKELCVEMRVCETQLKVWLDRAVDQGLINQTGLSGKYGWTNQEPKQDAMFHLS